MRPDQVALMKQLERFPLDRGQLDLLRKGVAAMPAEETAAVSADLEQWARDSDEIVSQADPAPDLDERRAFAEKLKAKYLGRMQKGSASDD